MNKYVLAAVFFLVFVAGVIVIFSHQSVSLSDVFRGLSRLSPWVMSLLVLPVIAVAFVIGVGIHKKKEERMWKSAVKKTHASRQNTTAQP